MAHKTAIRVVSALMTLIMLFSPASRVLSASTAALPDATIIVGGGCTLEAAIINANNNNQSGSTICAAGSGADTIVLQSNVGLWSENQGLGVAVSSTITIQGNGYTIRRINTSPNRFTVIGVTSNGNLTLNNVTVTGGDSNGGGAIHVYDQGVLSLNATTISNNTSSGSGGGILIYDGGRVTITNSTFSNNSAGGSGGAIFNRGATPVTVSNSTFSGNTASSGGAIYNYLGAVTILDSTLVDNDAILPGGQNCGGGILNNATIILSHSIVSGNTAASGAEVCSSAIANTFANSYNLFGHSGESYAQAVVGFAPGVHDFVATDDNSSPATHVRTSLSNIINTRLAMNGGPTQTHALVSGSPAIDRIANTTCTGPDQRGMARNFNGNNSRVTDCDIGAAEFRNPTVLTNIAAGNTYFFGQGGITIRVDSMGTYPIDRLSVEQAGRGHFLSNGSAANTNWWYISATRSGGTPATGYSVTLTLPDLGIAQAGACRSVGDGTWDCSVNSSGAGTITRSGISELSDWGVGPTTPVPPPCSAPPLMSPPNDYSDPDRLIDFVWSDVGCVPQRQFQFRIKTVPNMNEGGQTIRDTTLTNTHRLDEFGSDLDGRELYWSVRAFNSDFSTAWAPARLFRVGPTGVPWINFWDANGDPSELIYSNVRTWTFRGEAGDPENQLVDIEYRCLNLPFLDNCGTFVGRNGLNTWTYVRTDLDGRNDIRFVAVDSQGLRKTSNHHVDLWIDRASPATALSLNGESNPASWPNWFTDPVQVCLYATDLGTGRAIVGIDTLHYRLDGGAWQEQDDALHCFPPISADGTHSVEYYAVDKATNAETIRQSGPFQIDKTPPNSVAGMYETNGVISNQWQGNHNVPTFTWDASTDALSGVWGYELCFGPDSTSETCRTFLAAEPRQWTPQPDGVRTGTYYLRARVRDVAGNWTEWDTPFTYRYDGTPPDNPSGVTHAAGIANDTWQRTTNLPNFAWPVPHDEGSGIQGYYVYWGTDPNGISNDFIPANQFQLPTPLCGADETCIGYFRLRSKDDVGNLAQDWSTGFTLRYDNQPPVADFMINNGVTQTHQTLVMLTLFANDGTGSGVQAMRFSMDGQNWTDWEAYAAERSWTIPGISRHWWQIYLQVRDYMGLESPVVMREVYFDVNVVQPCSAGFCLWDYLMSAGGTVHTSSTYWGRSTVGQSVDATNMASPHYSIKGGYEAGSRARPVIRPIEHDEYRLINGIFASGTGGRTLTSAGFSLVGVLGEPGLPNNQTTISSQSHQFQPGFLAAAPSPLELPPLPPPGPPPPGAPLAHCDSASLTINGATTFTNNPDVVLNLCAPFATEMMISNDTDNLASSWEPYAETKSWTIQTSGQQVQPRFVYIAFKDPDGSIQTTYFDNIIYDPNPPIGQVVVGEPSLIALAEAKSGLSQATQAISSPWLAPNADGTIDLYFIASDDNSGLAEVQISSSPAFTDTTWQPYSSVLPWSPPGDDGIKTVYVRFKDSASNISQTAEASFVLDRQSPLGDVIITPPIVGPNVMTATVNLVADDVLSEVSGMRLSDTADFEHSYWRSYAPSVTWPISLTAQTSGAVYAQYRDGVGNVSDVLSGTYTIDTLPPQVYVQVEPAATLTHTLRIYAYDELTNLATMSLSNDPLMWNGVVTMPYTDTVTWVFDHHRVVWVQVEDIVGNRSEPYAAWAGPDLSCDIGGDGQIVTALDIQAIAERWLQVLGPPYDRNGDGVVNMVDIMWFTSRWGTPCE